MNNIQNQIVFAYLDPQDQQRLIIIQQNSPTFDVFQQQQYIQCAGIEFCPTLFQLGWHKVYVITYSSCDAETSMFAAGILEGLLTHQQIWNFYSNNINMIKDNDDLFNLLDYFDQLNDRFTNYLQQQQQLQQQEPIDDFVLSEILLYQQLQGMLRGYNLGRSGVVEEQQLEMKHLYYINSDGQISEIADLLNAHQKYQSQQNQYDPQNLIQNGNLSSDQKVNIQNSTNQQQLNIQNNSQSDEQVIQLSTNNSQVEHNDSEIQLIDLESDNKLISPNQIIKKNKYLRVNGNHIKKNYLIETEQLRKSEGSSSQQQQKKVAGNVNIDEDDDKSNTQIQQNSGRDSFLEIQGEDQQTIKNNLYVKKALKTYQQNINYNEQHKSYVQRLLRERCSALIKLILDENSNVEDILVSHSTWEGYTEMLRFYKFYSFSSIKGEEDSQEETITLSFSSYPGAISSTDDFYITSNNLVITETSISILPQAESSYLDIDIEQNKVPDFIRVMSSTLRAKTGSQWIELMNSKVENKMYCSQWMVLDYSNLQQGQPIPKGTFYILEQALNRNHFEDMSLYLKDNQYWASYNNPFFEDIREYSGFQESEKTDNYDQYNNDPRSIIFRKLVPHVKNDEDLKWLMQHNSWNPEENNNNQDSDDPTFGNPMLAIGARGDIIPQRKSYFGEVDSKVANLKQLQIYQNWAKSGPSSQEQIIFEWPNNTTLPHKGLPNRWDFDWVLMQHEEAKF